MVDKLVTRKLARAFPKSFINTALEIIEHNKQVDMRREDEGK